MTTTQALTVELANRAYPIHFSGSREALKATLAELRATGRSVRVIADAGLQAAQPAFLTEVGFSADEVLTLPSGEPTKSVEQFSKALSFLAANALSRDSKLFAFGGGVIGDLTGYVAASYLRGIDFYQIPTTLLSMVDSSVGGKTGINAPQGKNLIGAFHQPRLVLADTSILTTLPRREMLAGYAEVVKYGLIRDPAFFQWLEAHGADLVQGERAELQHGVLESCRAKAEVVAADERESGQRALLNLGHTFGHALEAETGYGDELLHGEGVAVGMVMAFDLSVQRGHCPPEDADRVRRHLAAVGLPTGFADLAPRHWDVERLIAHMSRDKKVSGGRITFVLVRGIGDAYLDKTVELDEVRALLTAALNDADQLARENEAPGVTTRATLGS